MSFCVNCGQEVQKYEKFCSTCGYPVVKDYNVAEEDSSLKSSSNEETVVRFDDTSLNTAVRLISVKKFRHKAKYIIVLVILIVVYFSVSLFIQNRPNTYGNSLANLKNGGTAVIQGKWIYFCTDKGLYKVKEKGGKEVKIKDGLFFNLNVIGDWIYCNKADSDKNTTALKIKTDGTKEEKIGQDLSYPNLITVVDNKIYLEAETKFYIMKTDGSEMKKLIDDQNTFIIKIDSNNVYTVKLENWNKDYGDIYSINTKITSVNISSGEQKLIFDGKLNPFSLSIEDKYLYYIDSDKHLVCCDVISKVKTTVGHYEMESYNMSNGWIYYVSAYERNLWKVRKDGTGNTRLTDSAAVGVNIAGDWIFYIDPEEGKHCRIRTDGTEKAQLE